MEVSDLKAWVILVGSAVAAVASVLNLWWQHGDRGPRFFLGAGSSGPNLNNYASLYVVNVGKVPFEIADYGFLLYNGSSYSIPSESLEDNGTIIFESGTTRLQPQDKFEVAVDINGRFAGVYCTVTTRRTAKFRFFPDCPFRVRLRRLGLFIWSVGRIR